MKFYTRSIAVALSALLMLSALTACGSTQTEVEDTDTTTTTTDVAPVELNGITDPFLETAGVTGDTVVATAGDIEITAADFLFNVASACDTMLSEYSYYGITTLPWGVSVEEGGLTFEDTVALDALDLSALYALLPVKAAEEGVTLSQEALDYIAEIMDATEAELSGIQGATYAYWQLPTTPEKYQEMLEASSYYQTIASAIAEEMMDETSDSYPDDQTCIDLAEELGGYTSKHILFATTDTSALTVLDDGSYGYAPLDDDTVAQQLALAQSVLDQLNAADPADVEALFDQLMEEYSDDSRNTDGTLAYPDGYVATAGQMVADYENAALALEYGQVSDIVESSYGYHIILRLPTEMDDSYRENYVYNALATLQQSWLDENPIVANEVLDTIDLEAFYTNLTAFREEINLVLEDFIVTEDVTEETTEETTETEVSE